MAFSEQLSKLRKEANLTQEDLAEKCYVSRQAVAKWEKADSLPDIYTVARLAELFGVSIERLIWSKDQAIIENDEFYIRRLENDDKDAFCSILKQNRTFGLFYESLEDNDAEKRFDNILWEQFKNGLIFVVCRWKTKELVGYFGIEDEDAGATKLAFRLAKDKISDADALLLTKDMCNWIGREYNKKALFVNVNSDFERRIFNSMGYDDIGEDVLITLPL